MTPLDAGHVDVPVRIHPAGDELARLVEWVLTDLTYTAPEDDERRFRAYGVLRRAVTEYREAVGPR